MIKKFNEYIKESKYNNIFDAAMHGDLNYIKRHINKSNIDSGDQAGWTALMFAVYTDHFDIVKYLVEHGADVNIKDNGGRTALISASSNNSLVIVRYLIEHGADINTKNVYDNTAYYYNQRYFDKYGFQKWYMDTIGNYEKLDTFVEGNIHPDIKKEYADDVYKMDLGL